MKTGIVYKIESLINLVAVTIGIILFSIGLIIFLNPVLKIYIFGIETNSYYSIVNNCANKKENKNLSELKQEQKYKKCILEQTEREKIIYKKESKSSMADGITFILVSLIILIYYRLKKIKNKKTTK